VQIVQQLDNADACVAITETAFLPQLLQAQRLHPALKRIVVLAPAGPAPTPEVLPAGARQWADVMADGAANGFDLDAAVAAVTPQHLAGIVYTSGTTGPAKGVELPHASLVAAVRTNCRLFGADPDRRYLSWLPTAGMSERITSHYMPIVLGGTVSFCDDPRRAAEALPDANPHIFFGAPRFWEKLKLAVEARWAERPAQERAAIAAALADGIADVRAAPRGEPPDDARRARLQHADATWFAPVRRALGLGTESVYVVSGGASAPMAVLEFFHAIGLPLDEAYGMTESTSFGTRNPRGHQRLGTVGREQPGVQVRLAADGEILIRAPAMMRGYRKRAEATAEALDSEGWLHTGDIGVMDADGYLQIIDRKKDLIVGTHGKKMSPANIEAAITMAGSLVAQAVAVGTGRNYNVALLTLDSLQMVSWSRRHAPELGDNIAALLTCAGLLAAVDAQVRRGNEQLARAEQVKRFLVIGTEWVPGTDEVTPTMKLRRRVIEQKYAAEIDRLYGPTPGD
jgi:long-chain acyl-CoA synthetase